MPITINHIRENEDDFTVFFIIDLDDEDYEFHADIPKDKNQQEWLEEKQGFIRFLILGKMYPEADWQRFKTEENDNYSAFKEWIAEGHKNQILIGYEDEEQTRPIYEYQIIEQRSWKSTHPPEVMLKAEIAVANTIPKLKAVVEKLIEI